MTARLRARLAGILTGLMIVTGLAGCGGGSKLTCDEPERYQRAVQHARIESPDDLDQLDSLREMPLPKANPGPERPPGSLCLDLPPRVGPSN